MSLTTISSNKNIKVFIADDSLVVREHLVTILDELPRIKIVDQAENVTGADFFLDKSTEFDQIPELLARY